MKSGGTETRLRIGLQSNYAEEQSALAADGAEPKRKECGTGVSFGNRGFLRRSRVVCTKSAFRRGDEFEPAGCDGQMPGGWFKVMMTRI
jgi:hypothetical protein